MQVAPQPRSEAIEFRLVVWVGVPAAWHAAVIGPDETTHEFVSPFELVRFLTWPRAAPGGHGEGLR